MENADQAEQSNNQPNNDINRSRRIMSSATLATFAKLKCRRRGKCLSPGTKCMFLDNSYPGYGWLLPGWVAEERHMESGRIYRYYYDPEGRLYRSQHEVIHAWEESGMVVIDK